MQKDTSTLIKTRHDTHGDWFDQAALSQWLKLGVQCEDTYENMSVQQQEAIEMILMKVARIVCGDATVEDHWNDIAGYAALGAGHGSTYIEKAKQLRRTKSLRNGKALA